ncbi:hypothetical protein ACWA5Z_06835 [Testudinibacter sp. P80/BLE/0925]
MKIFFKKENIEIIQFFPEPEDLDNYYQFEIESESEDPFAFIENKHFYLSDRNEIKYTKEHKPSEYHSWDGEQWILTDNQRSTLLADKKAEKLQEINTKAQAFVSQVAGLDKVPDYEVKTWQTQGEEAKAWHADKTALTPNLDAIAAARGIPADALKAKAYEKTVKFELLTAVVAGLRQGYEDINKAAKTCEEVEKINPVYKLPEVTNE